MHEWVTLQQMSAGQKVLGSVGGLLLYRMEPLLCIGEELPLLFKDLGTTLLRPEE